MGRLKADSAERIIELSKVGVNRHFIQQIIIEEGFKQTSITTVDNYSKSDYCDLEKEPYVRVPVDVWSMICEYFGMKEKMKITASLISDSICSENNN